MNKPKTLLIISISFFISLPLSISSSGEITKYKDKSGKISYTNVENNKTDLEVIETFSTKTKNSSSTSKHINYQLENLFNDRNTETGLLTNLKTNRNNLGQLFFIYEQQLKETPFKLNANTVQLEKCNINAVYDYFIFFCSGLESKQQRLLNELDLISNSISNIRSQLIALDLQINELESQKESNLGIWGYN